jgi:HSP20 family protein
MGKNHEIALTRTGQHALTKRYEQSVTTVTPVADVYDMGSAFVVKLDMPGADKDSISLTVEPGTLSIRAVVQSYHAESGAVFFREILPSKVYFREFNLGQGVDTNQIDATFEHGVLTITIQKDESFKQKEIHIK